MPLIGALLVAHAGYGEDKKSPPKPTCSYDETEFVGGLDGFCEETKRGQFYLVFKDHSGKIITTLDWPGDLKDPPPVDCQELCEAGAMDVAYSTDRLVVRGKSQNNRSRAIACESDADCPAQCKTCRSGKQACFGKKGCMDCDPKDDRIDCLPNYFCRFDEKSGGYKCRN